MRTTKRFTPQVLARYERQGRGLGTFQDYSPWHQVTRGDPASQGRSHLVHWRGRLRHLLSDLEWGAQLFGLMLPNVIDSTEQKPLFHESDVHPLAAYSMRGAGGAFPGTLELGRELRIKHPRVRASADKKPWTMTTDLVLVLAGENGKMQMLAIAVKPKDWASKTRTVDLLRLEREYWLRRGIPWLLITPDIWKKDVFLALRRISIWSLAAPADPLLMRLAKEIAFERPLATVTWLLEKMERQGARRHHCQCALWQAVWYGLLPIDLNRSWRPQDPIRILSEGAFREQNPVALRRSAWI